MPTVTNTIKRPDGTVATDAMVLVQLVGTSGTAVEGFVAAGDYSFLGTSRPNVNSSTGVWSVVLVANSLINPSGTRWKVTQTIDGITSTDYIEVPNGAGPYVMEDILDEAPASVASSALTNHLVDHVAAADVPMVLVFDGTVKNSEHGLFWPIGLNLGKFLWEAWLRYEPADGGGANYWISEGYGGAHAILAGFSGGTPSGNIWTGAATTSFSGDYSPESGEWLHFAVAWDGSNVVVFINGIAVGVATFAGPRQAQQGYLYLGGSDHNNLYGALAQVRGFEGTVAVVDLSVAGLYVGFKPERHFGPRWHAGGALAAFVADFTNPAPLIVDQSAGYNGSTHSGRLGAANMVTGTDQVTQVAEWQADETAPFGENAGAARVRTTPTAPSTPVGAKIFDSFSRADTIPCWVGTGDVSLGSTEAGSLGAKEWQNDTNNWAVFDGRAVCVGGSFYGMAYVNSDSGDMDVRVDRRKANGLIDSGLAFRVQDTDNFLSLFLNSGAILLQETVAGGNTTLASFGAPANANWVTLRVVTSGTGITAYTDSGAGGWTQIGTHTSSRFQAAVGAGLRSFGAGVLGRWDNFTVI